MASERLWHPRLKCSSPSSFAPLGMARLAILFAGGSLAACFPSDGVPAHSQAVVVLGPNVAVFAGGCFWSMEAKFEAVPGVLAVMSGAAGGTDPNLTVARFAAGRSGYVEAVQVTFDPDKVSYRDLVDHFWTTIDPTDPSGQFCDRGPNYRTAVFATPAQWADAQSSRAVAQALVPNRAFITPVRAVSRFWAAPPDQQDFARKNPVRYESYSRFCRRDERLRAIWGARASVSS